MRIHECNICEKAFSRALLPLCLRSHTIVMPYGCNECEKAFSQFSILELGFRIHTDKKPYVVNMEKLSARIYTTIINRKLTLMKTCELHQNGKQHARNLYFTLHQNILKYRILREVKCNKY